ncbi:clotting factor G beta subunit-like isoform X1 [Parasteatoda tepidariorum]|uniref:clotting factor G beta subunit-like isoform X1 n=1 Tax=Parasteatoda tepidariorum TaxID=114398 RepID=UPI001C71CF21|nr:venom serine protease Bi-VSP-like isoform X1 [Parasteatoda tepidariorum]
MMLSISLKLFACQIFLLLVVETLSQRIRFADRGPQYGQRYQCQSDSTCIAISRCPPARRVRNSPQCSYNAGYYRWASGVCCSNAAFPPPPRPGPPLVMDTAASDVSFIDQGGVRFPGRDPRTRSYPPYFENNQEQCPRRSRCIAWSRCPPSRRSRVPNDCYYEGYSRRNPGVCCVEERRRTLSGEIPNEIPRFPVSTTTSTTTTMAAPMNSPNGPDCGRSLAIAGMMIGGSPAGQNVYPWMVAITTLDGIPTCTASLIDRTHVLTAAHCFDTNGPIDTKIYALRIGNVDQRLGDRYTISNLAIPNTYRNGRYYSDVAVITLDRPVNSPDFMPICLPDSTFRNFTNRGVTLAGWGSTRHGGPTSDILMQLNGVSVVSTYQCNSIFGRGISGFNSQFPSGIDTSFICAGFLEDARGRDSCGGDSGGPMMVSQGGRWYQIGILSFGHMRCGEPGYPAVYTRVSSSMNFILGNL